MEYNKPNLFRYATSELSQDAVLCWLAECADPSVIDFDDTLYFLGQSFLKCLFGSHKQPLPEFKNIQVFKQYKSIDVLIIVEDNLICIEDKSGTQEHSNQLIKYLRIIKKEYPNKKILPVYIQTGDQASYKNVKDVGYELIHRQDLINLLEEYEKHGGTNAIAQNFLNHLKVKEERVRSYQNKAIDKWDLEAWQGFYSVLQDMLGSGSWNYVPNQSGGFLAYHWNWYGDSACEQYLQIEEDKLCFKIAVEDDQRRTDLRTYWYKQIREAGKEQSFPVVKPKKFGHGDTMTVALYNGEYRVLNKTGILDIESTVNIIKKASNLLDHAVNKSLITS